MTDAWCHGAPCFLSTAPDAGVWVRRYHMLCRGCFARENPHATGPHTRIVEEWEHEYGALCRVVVSPFVGAVNPLHIDMLRDNCGPEACAIVGGEPVRRGHQVLAHEWLEPGRAAPQRLVSVCKGEREAVSLAMLDAERLALEWSPPIDEEAA